MLHAYEIQCTTPAPETSRNKVMMTKLGHVRAKTKYQDQQDCPHLAVKGQDHFSTFSTKRPSNTSYFADAVEPSTSLKELSMSLLPRPSMTTFNGSPNR